MVLFVSANSAQAMKAPKPFDILGEKHDSRQTNESAVRYMYQLLRGQGKQLDKIFLITSKAARNKVNLAGLDEPELKSPLDILYELMDNLSLSEVCQPIDYDENAAPESCILQVADIAGKIQAYAEEAAGATPCRFLLHADMTGGYRHASMMMLAVLQLLTSITAQESQISFATGRILYANAPSRNEKHEIIRNGTVDDVTEIQRMMTLITGADEFVSYGSVKAIESYFANQPEEDKTPELRELLAAMRRFSEAINVCQVGVIRREIKNLGRKIDAFQAAAEALKKEGGHVQEQLFQSLTSMIRREYGHILQEHASNLDIIQWCIDKNFLQQALTLCTEWLPSVIVDHHIAYTKQKIITAYCREKAAKDFGTWQKALLKDYDSGGAKNVTSHQAVELYDLLQSYCKGKETLEDVIKAAGKICPDFSEAMKEYKKFHGTFEHGCLTYFLLNYMDEEYPHMMQFIDQECHRRNSAEVFHGDRFSLLQQIDLSRLKSEVFQNLTPKEIAKIFHLKETRKIKKNPPEKRAEIEAALRAVREPEGKSSKFYEANKRQRRLFISGEMITDYSFEDAFRCLFDYNLLYLARNQTNHANEETTCSAESLRQMMQTAVNHLKDLLRENHELGKEAGSSIKK